MTADPDHHTVPLRRPWDLILVAGFTILAGFAEIPGSPLEVLRRPPITA